MILEDLLPIVARIGPSLGNHLWQSTLFAGSARIMALLLRKNRPSLRHGLWVAASVKFLIPLSLLVGLGASLAKTLPIAAEPQNSMYSALEVASQPFDELQPIFTLDRHPNSMKPLSALLSELLLAIWLCGTIAALLVWYFRWWQVSTVLRTGEFADCGREVQILRKLESESKQHGRIPVVRSREMMEPGIFGIFHPILLWPEGLTVRLEDEHIKAILAHEVNHVRRKDNLTAAIHMLVEALFWFHPMVWWMESQMVQERERACDEAVVEVVGGPEVYAESLLKTCRFCLESPLVCVSGIAGADLRKRILRITTNQRGECLSPTRKFILAVGAFAVVTAPMTFGLMGAMQSRSSLLHPTSSPRPAFEAAAIKPNSDPQPGMRIELSPSNFNLRGGSIKDLIEFAYNVNSHDQLQGQPSWISSLHFDIHAKASENEIATIHNLPLMQQTTELRLMMQSLLADRFQLKVTFKTEELPVYALVVTKGGPKFKEVEVDPLPPLGTQPLRGAHIPTLGKTGPNQYTATAWDMGSTADFLSRFEEVENRVVVDETGLKGHYDFVLNGISVRPSPDGSATSIFTALEEQLGLKLVPRKAPLEVLVIDQIERPSEN
jgi:bla regulator protein blaR1